MITDEQLMADTEQWLLTPELQWNITWRQINFLADIHRQWRTQGRISQKQRAYTIAILNKHWRK